MKDPKYLKNIYHRIAAHLVARILRPGATYQLGNFELWQEQGYHILPVHFYSPVPDTRQLESSNHWTRSGKFTGIDWHIECQLEHLINLFPVFGREFADNLTNGYLESFGFTRDNNSFSGIDPAVLYAFLRHYKPDLVIEVGSGYSSRVMLAALSKNHRGKLISIDPYPSEHLKNDTNDLPHEIVEEKVECIDPEMFGKLKSRDILFIDSTHTVRIGGDVSYLFSEIMPRLRSGVIVHFHDIFLPDEYPREWVLDKHIFWSEQYILHAFLLFNPSFQILMANHFLTKTHCEQLEKCFPRVLGWGGGSFWIRRV